MDRGMRGFPVSMSDQTGSGFEVKTASGEWPWPAGVTAATFTIVGGGGGSHSSAGGASDGGNSSITYDSITYTANGGKDNVGSSGVGGLGGTGNTNGSWHVDGERGDGTGAGGDAYQLGKGGRVGASALLGYGGGAGGAAGTEGSGGGGEFVYVRLVKLPGQDVVPYVVAAAGTGTRDGRQGVVIISYSPPEYIS